MADIFVSLNGDDTSTGDISNPLRTIQEASNQSLPGDTIYIRAGTYRETVDISNSGNSTNPITITNYLDEEVIITGLDLLQTTWQFYNGNIYRTPYTNTLNNPSSSDRRDWFGNDQLFIDGLHITEARFPHINKDPALITKEDLARMDGADLLGNENQSRGTSINSIIYDNDLPPNIDGAYIVFSPGHNWVSQSGQVTSSSSGQMTIEYLFGGPSSGRKAYNVKTGNYYWIAGIISLMQQGSWVIDDSYIYLWDPSNRDPNNINVEVKTRNKAFDFSGQAYINLKGITIKAATIHTDSNTSNINIDDIKVFYNSHFNSAPEIWIMGADSGLGIKLQGANCTLTNSEIRYSSGHCVFIRGTSNLVENCVISHPNYIGASGSAIRTKGNNNIIRYNNVYHSLGRLIQPEDEESSIITHNKIHDCGLLCSDLGAIYQYGTNGLGTEISYNLIYNCLSPFERELSWWGGNGIYMDAAGPNGSNWNIHHNVIWNVTEKAIKVGGAPTTYSGQTNYVVVHNTMDKELYVSQDSGIKQDGTLVANNIHRGSLLPHAPNATYSSNLDLNKQAALFINELKRNYRLKAISPAIDTATITTYSETSTPDKGAYESNWTSGAYTINLDEVTYEVLQGEDNTALVIISNLPIDRELPPDYSLKIGGASSVPIPSTTTTTIQIDKVPYQFNTGNRPLIIIRDDLTEYDTGITFNTNDSYINTPNLLPQNTTVFLTLDGNKLYNPNYFTRDIIINSPITLEQYQVCITIDTASLIAQGKVQSNLSDFWITDNDNTPIKYWIKERTINTVSTEIWLRTPKLYGGNNTYRLHYGIPSRGYNSDGHKVFELFDNFTYLDTERWMPSSNSPYSIQINNNKLEISGTGIAGSQYNPYGVISREYINQGHIIESEITGNMTSNTFNRCKVLIGLPAGDIVLHDGSPKEVKYYSGGWNELGITTLENSNFTNYKTQINYVSNSLQYVESDNVIATHSGITGSKQLRFMFAPETVGEAFNIEIDNIKVRKYTASPPSITYGSEIDNSMSLSIDNTEHTNWNLIDSETLHFTIDPYIVPPDIRTLDVYNGYPSDKIISLNLQYELNEPTITISGPTSINEGNSYIVDIDLTTTASIVNLNYELIGNASLNSVSGILSINASTIELDSNITTASIEISVPQNIVSETNEQITFNLLTGAGYLLGTSNSLVTEVINEDIPIDESLNVSYSGTSSNLIPIRLDTQSRVNNNILSDTNPLFTIKVNGNEVPYFIEGRYPNPNTLIWLDTLPTNINTIDITYGQGSPPSDNVINRTTDLWLNSIFENQLEAKTTINTYESSTKSLRAKATLDSEGYKINSNDLIILDSLPNKQNRCLLLYMIVNQFGGSVIGLHPQSDLSITINGFLRLDQGNKTLQSTNTLTLGQAYLIKIESDNSLTNLYIDNQLDSTIGFNLLDFPITPTNPMRIGKVPMSYGASDIYIKDLIMCDISNVNYYHQLLIDKHNVNIEWS